MAFFLSRCFIFIVLACHFYELGSVLWIECDRNQAWDTLQKENFTDVSSVTVDACPLPEHSYAESLRELGVDPTKIRILYLLQMPSNLSLRNEHFAGLNLISLKIHTRNIHFTHSDNREPATAVDLSNGDSLNIYCENEVSQLSNLSPILVNLIVRVKKIRIEYCESPETYAKALWALNINPTGIVELGLKMGFYQNVPASSFHNLTLQFLSIDWFGFHEFLEDYHHVDVDIFIVVPTIENFILFHGMLPKLPASQLRSVSLIKGASAGEWGDCKKLKHLNLLDWQVPDIPEWVAHCPQLTSMVLKQLKVSSVQGILSGVKTLNELRVNNCELMSLSETLLADAVFLVKLDLSDNSLMHIHEKAFSNLILLEELSMSNNLLLEVWELILPLLALKRLRKFNLDGNVRLNFCEFKNQFIADSFLQNTNSIPIQEISLVGTGLTDLCFSGWSNLRILNVSQTQVWKVPLYGIMFDNFTDGLDINKTKGHDLLIDLRLCPLFDWPMKQSASNEMIKIYGKARNITLLVSLTFDCNCDGGWFARTLRSLPNLEIKGAVCSDGEPLQSSRLAHIQRLECIKSQCEGCICRRSWRDNSTEMDCIGRSLSAVPYLKNIPNMRSLQAGINRIDTLPNSFPDTLLLVNLTDNNIFRISPEATAALFSTRTRSVALAQNPIICDCENEPMIAALLKHQEQVIDFDNVTCAGNVIRVGDVDFDKLCVAERERRVFAGAAAGGGILVVALVAAILCYRYWKQIKVFLFARGWCLCYVKEHELDEDRPYDAFISFAHGDEQLVAEELLPVLVREYALCIHTRDWLPGELITTQVVRSVQRSRRTVIVLSRNFVRSVWGMLEFRTAHTSALSEGRVRLIVVLLDDVIDDAALDADLRWYLRTNTYLKWGDPWFWEKLRYAMPHRPSSPPENSQPPMPYDNMRFPQNEMPALRNDSENQQPIRNDPTVENGPDNF